MLIKSIFALMVSVLLANAAPQDNGALPHPRDESSYVKLEVRGKLFRKGPFHYVEARDALYADMKGLVQLARSEDKNHELTEYLDSLEGKSVIARGYLISSFSGREPGVIFLELTSKAQVTAIEPK